MKKKVNVGDLVQISVDAIMSGQTQEECESPFGIVIGKSAYHIRAILWDDGSIDEQHEHDLAIISELSDEQLDLVRGGMSYDDFELWKSTVINEG